jgi:hypothetical protein
VGFCGILGLVLEVEVIAARIYFKFIVHRNIPLVFSPSLLLLPV